MGRNSGPRQIGARGACHAAARQPGVGQGAGGRFKCCVVPSRGLKRCPRWWPNKGAGCVLRLPSRRMQSACTAVKPVKCWGVEGGRSPAALRGLRQVAGPVGAAPRRGGTHGDREAKRGTQGAADSAECELGVSEPRRLGECAVGSGHVNLGAALPRSQLVRVVCVVSVRSPTFPKGKGQRQGRARQVLGRHADRGSQGSGCSGARPPCQGSRLGSSRLKD